MTKRETKSPSPFEAVKEPGGDEGFLGRWARRKSEAETTKNAEAPALLDQENEAIDRTDEPPEFDVASLPDIDSLGPGSDFSVFMQAGVPPALKTKALRKLWLTKPELANLDGLVDYGEDLTGSFKVVDHLKTAYQVGKGFLKDDDQPLPDSAVKSAEGHERSPDGSLKEDAGDGEADAIENDDDNVEDGSNPEDSVTSGKEAEKQRS